MEQWMSDLIAAAIAQGFTVKRRGDMIVFKSWLGPVVVRMDLPEAYRAMVVRQLAAFGYYVPKE